MIEGVSVSQGGATAAGEGSAGVPGDERPALASVWLNRRELAAALRVTEPTIDRYRAAGMPVEEGGSNGVPYKFDLNKCLAWRRARDDDEQRIEDAKRRQIEEAQASLFGPEELPAIDGLHLADLSPQARAGVIRAHKEHLVLLQRMARLVDVGELELVLGGALAKFSEAIRAGVEQVGRRFALPANQVSALVDAVDAAIELGVNEAQRVVREVRRAADA